MARRFTATTSSTARCGIFFVRSSRADLGRGSDERVIFPVRSGHLRADYLLIGIPGVAFCIAKKSSSVHRRILVVTESKVNEMG